MSTLCLRDLVVRIMSSVVQDIRFALRAFGKNPGFTLAAVVSLAIGIGANTAIFSVANALLLRPLPYADADRLVILWNRSPGLNIAEDWFSTAQYFDIKNGHSGFEQLAIAVGANYNLTGDGEPERIGTIRVSSTLLPMLGAKPQLGRLFISEEDLPGRPGTAVLSHGTWARRYGRDPQVLAKSLTLNGLTYQRAILGLILRQASVVAIAGVMIGLVGAMALTRLMQSLLFGIEATDGLTFTAIPLMVMIVALLASYKPASRAARIDPMVSLRNE